MLGTWLATGALVLVGSMLVALTIGPAAITPAEVLGSAWHHVLTWLADRGVPVAVPENPLTVIRDAIVWQGRAPRLLTAASVGAGLALCGAVMQAITRNPLADPYLLGVSSGAALGAVAVLLLGVAVALPLAAFAGALLALGATLSLAGIGGRLTPGRTILAGIAVAQACAAGVSFVIFSTAQGDSYREIITWLMGSLASATWTSVAIAGSAVVAIGVVLLAYGRSLDAFAFGDTAAASLGVHVPRTRWLLLTLTALLTGALVSVSGSIGFVGLVLPHVVRLLVGARHVRLLPLAALGGAVFLVWADTGARSFFDPSEVPVGILTAAIGAPVFAWLLLRNRSTS
nr:putative F420-0 ABC transporter permease subunit [Ruania alba]